MYTYPRYKWGIELYIVKKLCIAAARVQKWNVWALGKCLTKAGRAQMLDTILCVEDPWYPQS